MPDLHLNTKEIMKSISLTVIKNDTLLEFHLIVFSPFKLAYKKVTKISLYDKDRDKVKVYICF